MEESSESKQTVWSELRSQRLESALELTRLSASALFRLANDSMPPRKPFAPEACAHLVNGK